MPDRPMPQVDPLVDLVRLEGVGSALAAAQAAVDVVLRGLPRRRVTAQQTSDALVEATRSSATLEPDPDRWHAGGERLGAELATLARQVRVVPGTVLARMHLLLARGVSPEVELGRTRPGVDGTRLAGVIGLLATRSEAPSMVLAAVAHAELASLQPFGPGSGVIARAVEHLVLIESRLDPVGMILVERGHVDAAVQYRSAAAGYATGTPPGVASWLSHCAAAVARGAELSPLAG